MKNEKREKNALRTVERCAVERTEEQRGQDGAEWK